MTAIPTEILTESLQRHLVGRRLHTGVFTTYEFDPAFFELQVLPALFDEPVSHASAIKRVQLEDLLKDLPGGVSVYFDAERLSIGDEGSGCLDIRRIPVRHTKGAFHPKNVLLLVEEVEANEVGDRARTLIVASLSANLTQSGWWRNLEAGHIEEIPERGRTRLRDDLLGFLSNLRRSVGARVEHADLLEVVSFLKGTEPHPNKSQDGRLLPHFYSGRELFPDFLESVARGVLRGLYLEIISPYFDDADSSKPLLDLIERFAPKQVRVFLPRGDSGEALCNKEFYRSVSAIAGLEWGIVPPKMLAMGRGEEVKRRFVHAKVYRFFSRNPAREILFVGSVNLTQAAHYRGNVESGFLVEMTPSKRPDFWLEAESSAARSFAHAPGEDGEEGRVAFPLDIRFHWNSASAEVYWDTEQPCPKLMLSSRGLPVAEIGNLAPRRWIPLDPEAGKRLGTYLKESSLIDVADPEGNRGLILVQEEGMSHKPSLLHTLSAADILRYWSLLTPAQRSAFLEDRSGELASKGLGTDLLVPLSKLIDRNTVFDRFAGIFHAFGCLERTVREALDAGKDKLANYRIFGLKYDSLGNLLQRVKAEAATGQPDVESYVTVLCARQLCDGIARDYPEFWAVHKDDIARLQTQIAELGVLRDRLAEADAVEMPKFLEWFERWFLKRAEGPRVEAQP